MVSKTQNERLDEVEMIRSSFLHISDLHFSRYIGSKSTKEEISHFEIKKKILSYITEIVDQHKIAAIIISGDLELDSPEDIISFFVEWLNKGCKIFIVFGDHDTKEKRKQLLNATMNLRGIYIFDAINLIEDPELDYNVWGMSCEPRRDGFMEQFALLNNSLIGKPTIFLTHPCALPKGKMINLRCQYFAVGHVHYPCIEKVSDNTYIGRPGHLYSIWDGNGKAWPVGAILGNFNDNSLSLEWIPFPVTQTMRLYIDKFKLNINNDILFGVENCTEENGMRLNELCKGEWEFVQSRGVFQGHYSPEKLPTEELIKGILRLFVDDIFVTPSDPDIMRKKYGFNRASFTAKSLLKDENIFAEFVERVFRVSEKTS